MVKNVPALGWNTWNTFGPDINEKLILESADILVSTGLRDAGYEYIVIDDCWALRERDDNNQLVVDPEKFPHGMKYVSDYVHSKGLKFGMYSCAGYMTCAGYPASYEHEFDDAKAFASWGVDFLKYDYCFHPSTVPGHILYKRMALALQNCGRDILFSACSWGADDTKIWIKETGANMWRSTGDISDSWTSIKNLATSQLHALEYNGMGCFNDMDMLVVGMNAKGNVGFVGCTPEEYKTHFALWAFLASPLMIGCDIRSVSEETLTLLKNKDLLRINQDTACRQPFFCTNLVRNPEKIVPGTDYYEKYPLETPILARFLDDGSVAIGVFNFTDSETTRWATTLQLDAIGLPEDTGMTLELTDVFNGEKRKVRNGCVTFTVPKHDCMVFIGKVVPAK